MKGQYLRSFSHSNKTLVRSIINNALAHIEEAQLPDGSFSSFSSPSLRDFSDSLLYRTTFSASNILACLVSCDESLVIRERIVQFLLQEKSSHWSFNYWHHEAPERNMMPYPDDLDDTFGALAALARHNPKMISGEALASVATMLTRLEEQEGGPYRTWLVGNESASRWKDVDPAVNATIFHFLSVIGIRLGNLEAYFDGIIQGGQLVSPYYPSAVPVSYFIARSYRGKEISNLASVFTECFRRSDATILDRAMAITSLVNLGLKQKISRKAIRLFLKDIVREGWKPHAFCVDPARNGKKHYAGSSALTAAFCVEALEKIIQPQTASVARPKRLSVHEKIGRAARSKCAGLEGEIGRVTRAIIEKTTDEKITALAYDFQNVLRERGKTISPKLVHQLALGNLYGWMAYDIYDDFLDEEGDPALLPSANLFIRELTSIYKNLEDTIPGSWRLFNTMLTTVDGANAWEQEHCRVVPAERGSLPQHIPDFGDYKTLSDRSIGHALGPLIELLALGYRPASKEYQSTLLLVRHYLVARQLDDDAHDWPDDLARGQINSVAALVLREYGASSLPFDEVMPHLQLHFWKTTIDNVTRLIFENIESARNARRQSPLFKDSDFLEAALRSIERSAEKAIAQRNEMLVFLQHYQPGDR